MKKLMCAVAALSSGICLADITSANIVGYNTAELTKGKYNTMTVQFGNVGTGTFSLNDIKTDNMTAAEISEEADAIQFWNPATSGYESYYLYSGPDADDGWYNAETDASFDDDYPTGKPAGTAFWYIARGTGTGTGVTSGEVESVDDVTITLTKGKYNLVASAYPTTLDLNAMVCTGLTAAEISEEADAIQFWNPATSGYESYYLYSGPDADDGWYNAETDAAFADDYPAGKPAGTAFWYIARGTGTGTITFVK
ncbi:MAG: hypothetical protein PUJ80_04005 [Verrucomicrobiota bacterium]|nr:hypothetical protein [Verrucomicrobiota bacterium]